MSYGKNGRLETLRARPAAGIVAVARLVVLGGVLGAGGWALAAERGTADDLADVEARLADAEQRLTGIDREYTQRRGLLGADEAGSRFEDAVYDYLMGNYDRAATAFYSLVESRALGREALAMDAQWYLAESLFGLGNWALALDAYEAIVVLGDKHPFYADAVRRELEIYGILKDHDRFYEVYKKQILSGRVPADDAVKYTVAKSFYRQGETVRAKSMFSEIGEDSEFFGRARYYLGTILATEGDYGSAIGQFEAVVAREGREEAEVVELANLALGRLFYETGDYAKAIEHYQQIGSGSEYFADQLYELVWTYIKREQWDNALRHLEIFLIAFPDHAYTMQMKITQAHLYMKEKAYEQALVSYEGVVDAYSPLQARLSELEASREDPAEFFRRIVDRDERTVAEQADRYALPAYAVEMLVEDDEMARAVDANRALGHQRKDVDYASRLLGEVDEALRAGGESIGTFGRGRAGLRRVRDDNLQARSVLIEAELDYLLAGVPEAMRADVKALKRSYDVLRGRTAQVQGAESAETDRYQAFEDQVREVQNHAARVRAVAMDLKTEVEATRRVLNEKRDVMSAEDVRRVEEELDEVDRMLDRSVRDLSRLESDTARRTAMASVSSTSSRDTQPQRERIVSDFADLHRQLGNFRRAVTSPDRGAFFSRVDALWQRADAIDRRAEDVARGLDKAEAAELQVLRERLREEIRAVGRLDQDVASTRSSAEDLAVEITRSEFGRLDGELADTVMRADMGIVDVYWLRKTAVSDEITRLAKERGLRMQELDGRFDVIRQKLEE